MSRAGHGGGHGARGASRLNRVKTKGKVPRTDKSGPTKEGKMQARDCIFSSRWGQKISDFLGVEYPERQFVIPFPDRESPKDAKKYFRSTA